MKIIDSLPKLKGYIPDDIIAQLPDVCVKFGIDGPLRLSHFLGQTREESENYTHLVENLNYSAQGLIATWPKHFPTLEIANQYARQPEKIANRAYANRSGNGDEGSGDGWKYRGRGALQTTGRDNYKALGNFLGVDLLSNPDIVATDYAMASAGFFFKNGNIWVICDRGVDLPTITKVTEEVNGGTLNLNIRVEYTQHIYNLLHS